MLAIIHPYRSMLARMEVVVCRIELVIGKTRMDYFVKMF